MKHKNLFTCIAVMAMLMGCGANPAKTASQALPDNKPEVIAFAVYGGFVIAEESAATIKEATSTPQAVKDALKAADLAASPAVESLHDAALAVKQLRAAILAGGPGAEALPAKLAALNQALTDTAPKVTKFTDALAAAKRKTP